MGEAALIALVNAACDAIFDYVVDSSLHDGIEAGEDTDVVFGTFVSGTGTYSYTDQDGTLTTEQAEWGIYSSSYDNLFIVDSEHVKWYLAQVSNSGTPQVGIDNWNFGVRFQGNGRYVGVCTVDGKVTVPTTSNIGIIDFTNYSTGWASYGYQSGTGNASNGSANPLNISTGVVTNLPDAHNVYNDIIVLPADSTTAYSYNDMRQMLQTYITESYPEYNINIPSWQEVSGETEPTEETGQSISIDYDEILSEDELESILTQETYEIPEYDTEFFTQRETDIFDDVEELPTELQDAPNFIVDSVKTGWDILQYWGVGAFFVGCATVCIIWKIIHGK